MKNLKEAPDQYDLIASKLKLGKQVNYKVGSGNRTGQEVLSGADSVIKLLTGTPLRSIQALQASGITFDKAFVNFREIEKSYMGTGSGRTWTYSLFGKDSSGNEIIYDKYEGGTAGGGQSWVFKNKKKIKASSFVQSLSSGQSEI